MYIQCQDVSVAIGGKKIVKQINLGVNNKQFIGIIGPNGSGKSTLLKSIYRILKPEDGIIYLEGLKINTLSYKESAKRMAVVSQHNYYNFDFTVQEVVLMGRSAHKKQLERDTIEDFKIVDNALKKVGMYAYKERIFSTLSGGEQQLIILARALAQQTQCLILDEPTNHLDIKHQLNILNLVKTSNFTVISAIHDLNIAAMYCDYLYILKEGMIQGEGTPEALLTQSLIKSIYEVDAKVIKDTETNQLTIAYQPLLTAINKGSK